MVDHSFRVTIILAGIFVWLFIILNLKISGR